MLDYISRRTFILENQKNQLIVARYHTMQIILLNTIHVNNTYQEVQCNVHIYALNHILCQKFTKMLHCVSIGRKKSDSRTNTLYILGPSSKFSFYLFPDHRTLKFLKVKCDPTNKKNCGLIFVHLATEQQAIKLWVFLPHINDTLTYYI